MKIVFWAILLAGLGIIGWGFRTQQTAQSSEDEMGAMMVYVTGGAVMVVDLLAALVVHLLRSI